MKESEAVKKMCWRSMAHGGCKCEGSNCVAWQFKMVEVTKEIYPAESIPEGWKLKTRLQGERQLIFKWVESETDGYCDALPKEMECCHQ